MRFLTLDQIARDIKNKANELGFDLCGITKSYLPTHQNYFEDWVQKKKYADMSWMGRNTDKRLQPQTIHSNTKSMIVVAASYHHEPSKKEYQLARYAHGQDYHIWMKEKLEELGSFIKNKLCSEFQYRSFVDTGPILERDLAQKAGIGWIGKNTCLIHPELGSFLFLGVLLNNLDLPEDEPMEDHCLSCRACLNSCPTMALQPYQLEPAYCLSYHTIEKRGDREKEYWSEMNDHLIGCDICQEVCPYNAEAPLTKNKRWLHSFEEFDFMSLRDILNMTPSAYKKKVKDSAVSRVKYLDFMRNVFLVIANTKRVDLFDLVKSWPERLKRSEVLSEWRYCLEVLESEILS